MPHIHSEELAGSMCRWTWWWPWYWVTSCDYKAYNSVSVLLSTTGIYSIVDIIIDNDASQRFKSKKYVIIVSIIHFSGW